MSGNGLLSAVIQLVLAIIASGFLIKVMTVRQDRRKIAGDASASEANAASVLTGASLQMVEVAQRDAHESKRDAHEAREEVEKVWKELNRARWRIHHLEAREAVLESIIRQAGVVVPPRPAYMDEVHTFPPPEADELPDPTM